MCTQNKGRLCPEEMPSRWIVFLQWRLRQTQDGEVALNPKCQVPYDFYGANINIQAVVGQNGSGKSSILELLYRIINNFTFMLELGMYRNSYAEQLFYVKGLHATLYYLLDGHIGTLVADGDVMHFTMIDTNSIYNLRSWMAKDLIEFGLKSSIFITKWLKRLQFLRHSAGWQRSHDDSFTPS